MRGYGWHVARQHERIERKGSHTHSHTHKHTGPPSSGPGTEHRVITITINGESRTTEPGRSVEELLGELGLHPRLIVVEHNREILDRARYGEVHVLEGDTLELVHFVGGG